MVNTYLAAGAATIASGTSVSGSWTIPAGSEGIDRLGISGWFIKSTDGSRIVGYSMLIRGIGDDADVAAAVPAGPAVELSKMYVLPSHHRTGAAAALMGSGIDWAAQGAAVVVWLGVNRNNERAQQFYRKHGFRVTGTRTFRLGSSEESDFVMVRTLSA